MLNSLKIKEHTIQNFWGRLFDINNIASCFSKYYKYDVCYFFVGKCIAKRFSHFFNKNNGVLSHVVGMHLTS